MSIKLFTQVFLCTAMLSIAGTMLSCSQNSDARVSLIINKLSASQENADSLLAIRETQISDADKEKVLEIISDSTIEFKAMTIATLLTHEDIAGYIINNPKRELVDETCKYLRELDGSDNVTKFAATFDATFKALSATEQAQFLTKIASPAECAAHLEPGDDELKDEIIKIYKNNTDNTDLELFNKSIKQNN